MSLIVWKYWTLQNPGQDQGEEKIDEPEDLPQNRGSEFIEDNDY